MALTPLSRRKAETYADFHKDLTLSPVNFDLSRKIDEDSIKESIRNIVMTNRGERLFQPNIGCDIRRMLFENFTPDMVVTAKEMISNAITSFEPRAELIDVDIITAIDSNSLEVIIVYSIINRQEPLTLVITLDKVR